MMICVWFQYSNERSLPHLILQPVCLGVSERTAVLIWRFCLNSTSLSLSCYLLRAKWRLFFGVFVRNINCGALNAWSWSDGWQRGALSWRCKTTLRVKNNSAKDSYLSDNLPMKDFHNRTNDNRTSKRWPMDIKEEGEIRKLTYAKYLKITLLPQRKFSSKYETHTRYSTIVSPSTT